MSPQNNETFGSNESTIEIKQENEVPSSRVQNGHNNTPRHFLSFRRRALIRAIRRNVRRRQRVQNSNTSNLTTRVRNSNTSNSTTRVRNSNTSNSTTRVQNSNTSNSTTDDNNDVQFFMSLLPYLQNLPGNIRLRIRDKVQRVIMQELGEYNNDNNEGSSNDHNNRNLPTPRPLNNHSVTPQEEVPQEEEAQDPIQHPVPVYPFKPYYRNVYGNVNNFVTSALPQSSEYSFAEQQAIPSYAGQQIYQPIPHLAGQHPLPSFAGQRPLSAFAGQQPLSAFAGQQSSQAFAGQQYLPPFVGQQQHNMPYFARQQ